MAVNLNSLGAFSSTAMRFRSRTMLPALLLSLLWAFVHSQEEEIEVTAGGAERRSLYDAACAWSSGACGSVRGAAGEHQPWVCGTEVLQCCTTRGTARVDCCADTVGWALGRGCADIVPVAPGSAATCSCASFAPAGCDPNYNIIAGICENAPPLSAELVPGPPGAPLSVTATVASKTSVVVQWGAAFANGSTILRYTAQVDVNSNMQLGVGTTLQSVDAGLSTMVSVPGLTPGTPYYVRVFAVNKRGNGAAGYAVPYPVVPSAVPDAPTTIAATAANATTITVAVSACSCADVASGCCNGKAVTQMKLQWSKSADFSDANEQLLAHPPATPSGTGGYSIVLPSVSTGFVWYIRASFANEDGFGPVNNTQVDLFPNGSAALWAAPSCRHIHSWFPALASGTFWLLPLALMATSGAAFRAHCDMVSSGGGWTLASKLKDASEQLDNHKTHKFCGATWHHNGSSERSKLTTAIDSFGSEAAVDRAANLLVPFTDSGGDSLWGSVDAAMFAFTELLIFHAREMAFGQVTAATHGPSDFMVFDVGSSSAWCSFPATTTKLPAAKCIKARVKGTERACTAAEFLSRGGDNLNLNPFVGGNCLAVTAGTSVSQGICLYTELSEQQQTGYNFMTWEHNASQYRETCLDPDYSGLGANPCDNSLGRRFEIYVR